MKKAVLLLLLLGFVVTNLFGQSKSDSIKVVQRLGTVFQRNGKNLTPGQLNKITQTNPEAAAEMKIANTNYNVSLIFQIPGGFLIGYPLGTAIAGGNPNWSLAAIGAGLLVVSIPLIKSYNKHARNAAAIYNRGIKYSSFIQPNIKLGFTSDGIGLRINF